jgi:hypothetical protein
MKYIVIILFCTISFVYGQKDSSLNGGCETFNHLKGAIIKGKTLNYVYYYQDSIRVYVTPKVDSLYGNLFAKGVITGKMLFRIWDFCSCNSEIELESMPNFKDELKYKGKFVIIDSMEKKKRNYYEFSPSESWTYHYADMIFSAKVKRRKSTICLVSSDI